MDTAVQRSYTPEEVDTALVALIALGSSVKAAETLAERFGLVVPASTLRSWRRVHHERYIELVREHGDELESKAIDTKRALLPLLAEGISLGVEKTIEELEAGDAKDPSASARNLAVISGIETRDLLTLTGRPSEIRSDLSLEDLYRKLRETLAIDAESEEISTGDDAIEVEAEGRAGLATQRDASSQRAQPTAGDPGN